MEIDMLSSCVLMWTDIPSIILLYWEGCLVFKNKQTNKTQERQLINLTGLVWLDVPALPEQHVSFLILGIVLVKDGKPGSVHNAFLETPVLFTVAGKEAAAAGDKEFLQSK